MRIKMEDVAKVAGVSKATVSLALSDSPLVSEKTRARVKRVADRLGYEPNSHAQRLALQRSGQIGLIVPDIENVYYASLLRHMNAEIQRAGYSMFGAISDNSPQTEAKLVREMLRNAVDALVLVPTHNVGDAPPSIEAILRSRTPAVLATSNYKNAGLPCVMCDLYGGMRDLSSMLLAQGLRRQMLLSAEPTAIAFSLRVQGFFDALAQGGGEAHKAYLPGITYDAAFAWAAGADLSGLDAVLCVNDMMALGALDALRQRGLRVPEDIAVTGFDDVIFSRITSTPITTVRQDLAEVSRLAVEHVVRGIQDPREGEDILIPCQIIRRASTPPDTSLTM